VTGDAPEAITEDELERALRELATRTGNGNAYFPDLARNIFGYLRGHLREIEHQSGDCVHDAQGRPFIRSGGCSWIAWSGARVNDDELERPLRRLVPEGSRGAVAGLVGEWRRLGEEDAQTEFQTAYRAALRKCADELGCALREDQR